MERIRRLIAWRSRDRDDWGALSRACCTKRQTRLINAIAVY
ncbi:MAG: hypothetical protein SW833_19190 [Cyanobacteriota bacterium]|nr:hypothetical protein [Cyanobacteriota bacterium]